MGPTVPSGASVLAAKMGKFVALLPLFGRYPKVLYTTNAIESLNSVIRHAIRKRKVFPTDESVKKWCGWQSRQRPRNGQCR